MEIGLTTFADASHDVPPTQRLRETVEQMALADQVGLDVFGVGEHHRADYLASAPTMVLAAGAERTSHTDAEAADLHYPPHSRVMNRIGRERGWSPTNRAAFDASTTLAGPYVVGSPERVAEKMLHHHELFGHDRIALQFAIGDIAHADVMRAVELLGTEVAPLVRDEVARRRATPAAV